MTQLLQTIRRAEQALPIDLEVTTDILDEHNLPMVVIERERGTAQDQSALSVRLNTEADVYIAFQEDVLWADIEAVTGALMNAYLELKPATDITDVVYGRGASGTRLAKCTVSTGAELVLQDLDDDFSYSYSNQ